MFDWREFLKGERGRISIRFIECYFSDRGIQEPTLKQIALISYDDLISSYLSMPTVKEIQLLQQEINRLRA